MLCRLDKFLLRRLAEQVNIDLNKLVDNQIVSFETDDFVP
jgi:hypothetical protein